MYFIRIVFSLILISFSRCQADSSHQSPRWRDPNEERTFQKLITAHGFALQAYSVTTDDGYILTIHRIVPRGYSERNYTLTRRPVILQHGLLGSANNFFINSPAVEPIRPEVNKTTGCGDNFGFCLVRTGHYDVWAPNSRGNGFSNGHVTLNPKERDFWNFTFDEMARFDLPASIRLIQKVTGHQKVGYVGHSQVRQSRKLPVGVA